MKEILIPLNFTTNPTVYDTKQSFSTSDEASWVLTFTTTADVAGTVASLIIRNASENANRQTVRIERLDVNSSPFSYAFKNPLPFGQYEGTVLLKKNLTVIASASFLFGVNSSLSAEVLPDLVKAYSLDELVESVETEVSHLKDAYNVTVSETVKGVNKTESSLQAQENVRYLNEHQRKANELERIANEHARIAAEVDRKDTFDTLVDSEVIEQTVVQEVAEKYQEIEALHAPEMFSFRQQLADKAEQREVSNIIEIAGIPILFEPVLPSDEWKTDSTGRVLNINTDQFYDLFYNSFVGTHENGYTVTKTQLGLDESGTYPIYEYDFRPTTYSKTILLTSGMHTYELPASFGLGYFMQHLMSSEYPHHGFKLLKENIRIKIIPIVNPWGFNQNPKTYGNVNGVNPNRNFDYEGAWDAYPLILPEENEWNYKGTAPYSESETQILRDWVLANEDAEFWIDCHTGMGNAHVDNWLVTLSNLPIIDKMYSALLKLEGRIRREYNRVPTKTINLDSASSIKHKFAINGVGIPTITLEATNHWGTSINNEAEDILEYQVALSAYVFEFLGVFDSGAIFDINNKFQNITGDGYFISDSFERSDSDVLLETETGGKVWTKTYENFGIRSGKAVALTSAPIVANFVETGEKDFEISVDISWNVYAGIIFRQADIYNYRNVVKLGTIGLSLFVFENSLSTPTRRYDYPFTPTKGQTYNLKIIAVSTRVKVYLDNVLLLDVVDSGNINGTKVGLLTANDTLSAFDNLSIRTKSISNSVTEISYKLEDTLTKLDAILSAELIICADTFDDTKASLINSKTNIGSKTWIGQDVAGVTDFFEVVEGKAKAKSTSTNAHALVDVKTTDCELSADITFGSYAGLFVRTSNIITNYVLLRLNSTGLGLFENLGTSNKIGTYAFTPTQGQNYKLKVRLKGTNIKIFVDDVLQIDTIVTSTPNTLVGLRTSNDTLSTFDNFTVKLI